ncbi:hypothetical protein FB471_3993 [Amycolatopsis cihanbeyliensis]|uniref:Uncharacterized protein n=2 Tax=Amycolatopsis cihanbeyliensis TaxID=1128664 RepID=A0A542DM88_AMYCI|nr:hypothetical protein FB471_3993 [Amycolatopsis cihanbeyliensis]
MRSREAGFQFTHLHNDGELTAIHAQRWRSGALDTYVVRSPTDAYAARFRAEERHPLWQLGGPAAEVIEALLDLPAHDTTGAPTRTRGGLWLP